MKTQKELTEQLDIFQKMKNLTYNGFTWSYFSKGIHTFTKEVNGKFVVIECEDIQLTNGDIEFMTANEITLSPERIKKVKNKYIKSNLGV